MKTAILTILLATNVMAYSSYDHRTGNRYYVTENFDGSTTVRGYNYRTGASWRQTTDRSGNYRGVDSSGNYYRGNQNTGRYHNSGTGKTCYGKGFARTCY